MDREKQPLDYRSPTTLDHGKRLNAPWKVLLRILAGLLAGIAACGSGVAAAYVTNVAFLFCLPPAIVFGLALFISIRYRRYGYTAGVVLAPFVIAVVLFIFLWIECSGTRI